MQTKVTNYLAVSLVEYSDNTYKITATKIDQATRRVVPQILDVGEHDGALPLTDWELIMEAVAHRVAIDLGLSPDVF